MPTRAVNISLRNIARGGDCMYVVKYGVNLDERSHPFLVAEENRYFDESGWKFNSGDVARLLCDGFGLEEKAEEHIYMLAFTVRGRLLGAFEVAHGYVDGSPIRMREIFIRALLAGSQCFVVAHNHPSGDCTPSEMDKKACKSIKQAARIMDLHFADFIIVGASQEDDKKFRYLSFKQEGLMK